MNPKQRWAFAGGMISVTPAVCETANFGSWSVPDAGANWRKRTRLAIGRCAICRAWSSGQPWSSRCIGYAARIAASRSKRCRNCRAKHLSASGSRMPELDRPTPLAAATPVSEVGGRGYKNPRYLLLKAQRMAATKTEFVVFKKAA